MHIAYLQTMTLLPQTVKSEIKTSYKFLHVTLDFIEASHRVYLYIIKWLSSHNKYIVNLCTHLLHVLMYTLLGNIFWT
jgi:hypothetical protein